MPINKLYDLDVESIKSLFTLADVVKHSYAFNDSFPYMGYEILVNDEGELYINNEKQDVNIEGGKNRYSVLKYIIDFINNGGENMTHEKEYLITYHDVEYLNFTIKDKASNTITLQRDGDSLSIQCRDEEDLLRKSSEIASILEKMDSAETSIIIDTKCVIEQDGEVEYELRQNIGGNYVIIKDVNFNGTKIKLPLGKNMNSVEAIASWVSIK